MNYLGQRNIRRLVTATMAGVLVCAGLLGATAQANASGMTVITPRGTTTVFKTGVTPFSTIYGIAEGKDGNVWYTGRNTQKVGRITPAGNVTEFSIMGTDKGIALGPDGNMWTVTQEGSVFRVKPDGTMDGFSTPETAASFPYEITAGPDGNMWFTGAGNAKIFRVSMTGSITAFADPLGDSPGGIAVGPDGALWYTDFTAHSIVRMTIDGSADVVATGLGNGLFGIAAGPDGSMWTVESGGNNIDRIQMDGTVTSFPIPTPSSLPWNITAGPDGAMWFVESATSKIGRITMDGHITEYPLSASTQSLTVAPDGSIWTGTKDSITRVTTGLAGAPTSVSAVPSSGAATVSWSVPLDSGFNSVTSYKVTATPGGATCVTVFTACQISGLQNGNPYTFTVQAANSLGFSPAKATSAAVTPKAPPSIPRTLSVAFAKKATVTAKWKAPTHANGAPVTGYQVKWTVVATGTSTAWINTAKTSATKAGFAKGQKLIVQVRAVNAAGTSPIASLKFTQGK